MRTTCQPTPCFGRLHEPAPGRSGEVARAWARAAACRQPVGRPLARRRSVPYRRTVGGLVLRRPAAAAHRRAGSTRGAGGPCGFPVTMRCTCGACGVDLPCPRSKMWPAALTASARRPRLRR